MKKIYVSFIALITALTMSLSVGAFSDAQLLIHRELLIDDEPVTVIVELEDEPVLASDEAMLYGTDYIFTPDGIAHEESLLQTHEAVLNRIEDNANTDINPQYNYTAVFNGFAIEIPASEVNSIRNIPNVKNVHITYPLQLYLDNAVKYTNSLPSTTKEEAPFDTDGYTGAGQIIAIIDSEFDIDHEFFSEAPPSPAYDNLSMINKLNNASSLKVPSENFDKVYRSAKIPFAYNYTCVNFQGLSAAERKELITKGTEVYKGISSHGTHVAGIAAGKSDSYSGVAPDAQLFLMRTMTDSGSISTTAALAAINDAVILGADVINLSIGTDYTSPDTSSVWETPLQNAKNLGVAVCVSAGNSKMSFSQTDSSGNRHFVIPSVTNPDAAAMGSPAGFSSVTAVASTNDDRVYQGDENYKQFDDINVEEISGFSSWGVNETLELKPEISAPGWRIKSSVFNNSYGEKSGTSMASPHMAGIYALMYEYFETHYGSEADANRTQQIENMLMSTARIIRHGNTSDGVPYSPRVQGAGMVDTFAAMHTPAILIGNSNKSKISLGGNLTNKFDLSFTVRNLTGTPITYDNISIEVSTNASNNGAISSQSKALTVISGNSLAQPVTVPAYSDVALTFNIELSSSEIADNAQIFTNGFFIDGFATLSRTDDTLQKLSIPFTGFYGNWAKAPALDQTMYHGGSALRINGLSKGTYFATNIDSSLYISGLTSSGYNAERIAISPNEDGLGDELVLFMRSLRTLKNPVLSITDGEHSVSENFKSDQNQNAIKFVPKYHESRFSFDPTELKNLPDGEYVCTFEASFNADGATPESFSVPVVIDRQLPEFTDIDMEGNTLTVKAKDNHLLEQIDVYIPSVLDAELNHIGSYQYPSTSDATATFNLPENIDKSKIRIGLTDCAMNYTYIDLKNALDNIVPNIVSYSLTSGTVDFNAANTYTQNLNSDIILGCYDSSNKLLKAATLKNTLLSTGQNTVLNFTGLGNISNTSYFKLFLWDTVSGLKPLDSSKIYNVQ